MIGVLGVCEMAVTMEWPRVGEDPPAIAMVRGMVESCRFVEVVVL